MIFNTPLVAAVLLFCSIWFLVLSHDYNRRVYHNSASVQGTWNTTLGFEKLFVVSASPSWRTEGIIQAAQHTDLELEIIKQPEWSDEQLALNRASLKSWLGHTQFLEHATGFTTSVALEDDVDWDVEIHKQTRDISEAVRSLTRSGNETAWGGGWDVLYLGHCGENIPSEQDRIVSYPDPTVRRPIHSWEGRLNQPGGIRYIHWSYSPICTFGYAVTGAAAEKLLELAANDTTTDPFDNWLNTQCRKPEVDITCISVNPEIFHDHKRAGEVKSLNNEEIEVAETSKTENILHSARCNAQLRDKVEQWEEWEREGWARDCEQDGWPDFADEEPSSTPPPRSPWWGQMWP